MSDDMTIEDLQRLIEQSIPRDDDNIGRAYRRLADAQVVIARAMVAEIQKIRGCDQHEDCRKSRRLAMACALEQERLTEITPDERERLSVRAMADVIERERAAENVDRTRSALNRLSPTPQGVTSLSTRETIDRERNAMQARLRGFREFAPASLIELRNREREEMGLMTDPAPFDREQFERDIIEASGPLQDDIDPMREAIERARRENPDE